MRSRAADRRQQEKQIVSLMISIYCRKRHKPGRTMSQVCYPGKYAAERSERCPLWKKTFCSNCKSTLLFTGNEEEIKKMRFSVGDDHYHPVMAIRHVKETKKRNEREEEK